MSKPEKDLLESAASSSLRRTINNPIGSSTRRSEEYDGRSSRGSSKSSDSSPERKKTKFGKPVARGSETGIIYNKGELKKISITITNKLAKPPLVQITNPETIMPVRRPDLMDHGDEYLQYRLFNVASDPRRYEGKRPIFFKPKESSRSPENRKPDPLEGSSRRKGDRDRKRAESPEYRSRKSRRDSPGRRHRRNRSTPSRHSCSSSSSSSSEERRRRKHYYRMRSEREREQEKRRREYEKEMIIRDLERRQHRPPSPPHPHPHSHPHSSNGGPKPPPPFLRKKEEKALVKLDANETEDPNEEGYDEDAAPAGSNAGLRLPYPVRAPRPPPPYMMRPPLGPFVPPFVPPYPHPPRPGFYHMPPVPFRPMHRPPRPARGFFHP